MQPNNAQHDPPTELTTSSAVDQKRVALMYRYILNAEARHPSSKELALFREFLQEQGYSVNSIATYFKVVSALVKIGLQKPLSQITAGDVATLIRHIQVEGLGDHTIVGYRTSFRRLLEWMNDHGYGPGEEPVAQLREGLEQSRRFTPKKKRQVKLPAYLTPDELAVIQKVCPDVKWRALFASLYATGARVSELLAANIGDVELKGDKVKWSLRVSKTTPRTLPWVKEGAKELLEWRNAHPNSEDPNAPLFLDRFGGRLSYVAVHHCFKNRVEPAAEALLGRALGKPGDRISIHTFRHSRATNLAQSLTPAQMAAFFGWTQSSQMMAIYINGAGVAAEDGMRRHYNEPLDIRPEIAYRVVDCDCGYGNPDGASFCSRCGSPLTDEARAKISERARAADARHTQETERLARLEADLTDVRGFLTNLGMQTGLERTLVEAKNQPPELVTLPDSAGGMRLTAMTVKRYGPSDALPAKVAKVLEKLEKRAKKGKEAKA